MRKLTLIIFTCIFFGCADKDFNPEWTNEKAPQTFHATFETTKGPFEIKIERKWSPKAADRLYQLIKYGYYDESIFYRVVPNFVAQFGNNDTAKMSPWKNYKVPDETVRLSNTKGTISFARFGKDSRDLELFINLNNNTLLDTLPFEGVTGFPALGNVTKGMDIVEKLYGGYGEKTMSDENLYGNPKVFYKNHPKLDLIKKAYLSEGK